MRHCLVLWHRWVGLVMVLFLVMAGLTGSLLAWYDELEAAISPQLFYAVRLNPKTPALDPVLLRAQFLAQHPGLAVPNLPLHVKPGRALPLFVDARPNPGGHDAATKTIGLVNDQIFINPYTSEVLGERKWGDISQGIKNLMPFVYRLHYQLALGVVGTYTFGIIALLWTLDCFVGVYLTLPAAARRAHSRSAKVGRKSWLIRWKPAWKVRWHNGSYKLNFDLHRAGGLWLWAMLFVLAWSSVAFNLPNVYQPVMKTVFAHQPGEASIPLLRLPQQAPLLSWSQARERGRALMAEQAQRAGFVIHREDSLAYLAERGVFRYEVHSSLDLRERSGYTQVCFDANIGVLRTVWLPTRAASGDTISTWLTSLHMAALWGVPMKMFVCMMGLALALLSMTGVIIWWRKYRARN